MNFGLTCDEWKRDIFARHLRPFNVINEQTSDGITVFIVTEDSPVKLIAAVGAAVAEVQALKN